MPSSSAFAVAPYFISTKNGFVSVLVIRQAEIPCPPAKATLEAKANAEAAHAVLSALFNVCFILFSQKYYQTPWITPYE